MFRDARERLEALNKIGIALSSETNLSRLLELIVKEARNLAIKEILPTREIGDQEGARFESGVVTVPKEFHRLYDLFKEGEWVAMTEDPEWGGQGMPRSVALAAGDYFNGANYAFMMYPGLTHGAGKLVEDFGTDKQKKMFLKYETLRN